MNLHIKYKIKSITENSNLVLIKVNLFAYPNQTTQINELSNLNSFRFSSYKKSHY